MTYQDALKVIKTVSVFYQNFVITEERIREWALVIQEYEYKQIMDNLKAFARENKFPPTLADLLQTQTQASKSAAYIQSTPEALGVRVDEAKRFLETIEGKREVKPVDRKALRDMLLKGAESDANDK
jgi:glutamine synthetase adenylyltransferase